ncbi:unnamed protein product [Paramecium pentaurelia]|uniref:Transmembrane protein n=1 Tax=Paramecium pentaurelia TaxID=43138 RepID=A0A8S1Y3K0_9CILI|nr:unnamed protein product [Paramecium pentaurelia]
MTKKYTLQFSHPTIEQVYQKDRIMKYLWMKKILAILIFLLSTIELICSFFYEKNEIIYWEISFTIYSIFLVIISLKGSPELVKTIFQFTNIILCILQIRSNYYQSPQSSIYLNGQNIMIFNMIIFYFSSIQEAPIQLIFFLITRCLITGLVNDDIFMGQDLITIIITSLGILIFIYQNDQIQRGHFLLEFSDKQWEQTLPIIIQSPFVMFTFDEERLNFNLKINNDMSEICWDNEKTPSENLRFFLRTFKMGNDNLEQYLVTRSRTGSDYKKIHQFQLRLQRNVSIYGTKKYIIRFSDFYLREHVFLIVFDQHEEKLRVLDKVKTALIQGINQHQNLTINFLQKQIQLLQTLMISNNSMSIIYKMKIHCMYFIGKYKQCNSFQEIEQKIIQINITDMIKGLIHLYCMAYQTIQIEFSSSTFEDIYVFSNEQILNIFLVIIFQTLIRLCQNGKTVFVHISEINKQSDLELIKISILFSQSEELKQKLLYNQLFYKIQVRLSPKVDILSYDNTCQFEIYKDLNQLNAIRMLEEEIL